MCNAAVRPASSAPITTTRRRSGAPAFSAVEIFEGNATIIGGQTSGRGRYYGNGPRLRRTIGG
jgi:hypothetical protein